jgi:hypothetical protein
VVRRLCPSYPRSRHRRPHGLPPYEWLLPSRFLHVGDDTIHYIDAGKGPTILFVEASMWSFIWRDVINQLRATFRCVALDFPGTGLSSRTTRDRVSIAAYADVLDAVIDLLRLDDITLVLHDLGGARSRARHGRWPPLPHERRPRPLRPRPAGLRLLMIHLATRDRAARPIPAGHCQIINDNPGRLNAPQPTTAGAMRQPLSTRAATTRSAGSLAGSYSQQPRGAQAR